MKFHRVSAERARALRHKGVAEPDIIAALGGKYTTGEIDWLIEEIRNQQRVYAKKYYARLPAELERRIVVDAGALAERDRRLSKRHSSLTAALCGDPLPGLSALDRRTSA